MKKWIVILGALLLAGCQTDSAGIPVVQTKYIVVAPTNDMYQCPQLASLPSVDTLTDLEVAKLISRLDESNKICGASMASLKKFYTNAKKRFPG